MWLTTLFALLALMSGLLDFCLERLEDQLNEQLAPGDYNELTSSITVGDTIRADFSPYLTPAGGSHNVLMRAVLGDFGFYGGSADTLEDWELVSFEFDAGHPGGWVEYIQPDEVRDCSSGARVKVRGTAVLLVHFDGAVQSESFDGLLDGGSVVSDAQQVCNEGGVLEWALGLKEERLFWVQPHFIELPAVHVYIAKE